MSKRERFKSILEKLKYQKVNEGRTIATEALRDIIDDFQVGVEMLIDEKYGEVDVDTFKQSWAKLADGFERQFRNILKNMSK